MAVSHLEIPELPEITVTRNKGQRSLRLRIKEGRVQVSAPNSVSQKMVREFVASRKDWIRQKLNKHQSRQESFADLAQQYRHRLLLRGDWKPVEAWEYGRRRQVVLQEHEDRVTIRKEAGLSGEALHEAVNGFYRHLAKQELPRRVDQFCRDMPVSVTRVTIRNQKTRWGSCSSRGSISLNWRIMKMPPEIRDYILLHELCHRFHMDHSRKFWKLLRAWYPKVDEATRWIKNNEAMLFADIGYGSMLIQE